MAKVFYEGKWVETENVTPSWSQVVNIYIEALTNPNTLFEHKQIAIKEIKRMAAVADLYIEKQKQESEE